MANEDVRYVDGVKLVVDIEAKNKSGNIDWLIDGAVEGNQELKIFDTYSDNMRAFSEIAILPRAFSENSSLETVIIGRNIFYLGEGAFSNCAKLQTFAVEFVSNLRRIPDYCAAGCVQLKNLILPNGIEEIGERAFYGCSALEAVVIPESMQKIGKEAFFMCPNLQTVVSFSSKTDNIQQAFQQKVEFRRSDDPIVSYWGWIGRIIDEVTIESHTIHGWKNIVLIGYKGEESLESLEIPDSFNGIPVLQWHPDLLNRYKELKTINWKSHYIFDVVCLFAFPRWVQEIKLPQFKKLYGNYEGKPCFMPIPNMSYMPILLKRNRGPENMLKTLWLPEGLLEIGQISYGYQYVNFRRLELPSSLEKIKHNCFYNCDSLTEIIFHDSPVVLEQAAFAYCKNLEKIEFGNRILEIHKDAFKGCPVKEVLLPLHTVVHAESFPEATRMIRYEGKCLTPGIFETMLENESIITYTISKNPQRAVILSVVAGSTGKVTIPKQIGDIPVTAIGDGAVAFQEGIRELVIPESIKEIGILGIYGCPDLQVILLEHEEQLPQIYKDAIASNPLAVICVKNQQLRDELKTMVYNSRIFSLKGKNGAGESEEEYVFYLDTGLLQLTGHGMMKSYKSKEVNGKDEDLQPAWKCIQNRIRSLTLEGFETVGAYGFSGLEQLASIQLNEGVKWISQYAFANCCNLTSVQLPKSLVKIYSHGFYNCKKLENIVFPEGLELIGSHAFYETALKVIHIPKSVKTLGTSAFMECRRLEEIYLHGTKPAVLGSTGSPVNTVFWNTAENCRVYTRILNFSSLANNCNYTTQIIEPEGSDCGKGKNGEVTSDVQWLLDFEGILQVSGRKPDGRYSMMDYSGGTPPWTVANQPIFIVLINSEVKEIGAFSFYNCLMEKLYLYGTEYIGEQAFSRCSNLREVHLPATLRKVEGEAFAFLNRLEQVYYEGTKEQFRQIEWGKDVFRLCNNQLIQCKNGIAVGMEEASKLVHLEYRIFAEDKTSEKGALLPPVSQLDLGVATGINQVEIYTFEGGTTQGCLEGSYTFWEPESNGLHHSSLQYSEDGLYRLKGPEHSVLTAIELRMKYPYNLSHHIGYQICSSEGWREWRFDDRNQNQSGNNGSRNPITNLKISLKEKKKTEMEGFQVSYWAESAKEFSCSATNGAPVELGDRIIRFLWLTCTLNGIKVDCLECNQHISIYGDLSVPYHDSRYCFGKEGFRLEGISLKLKPGYEDYQIRYCVNVEQEGWQEWKQDDELAGTQGKSKGIHGVRIEIYRK